MNADPTLFSQIQALFERTYTSVGVNLEDCLVDSRRSRQLAALAGAQCAELADYARTFLRAADGQLRIGIYFSEWLIAKLEEHDPRAGLTDNNIQELIAFVEEINHALHAALAFQRGEIPNRSEDYCRNLELQARVDTYLVLVLFMAFFRKPKPINRQDRKWLQFHLFESISPSSYSDDSLRGRYMETTYLAASYTRYLESLATSRRVDEIRCFHALSYKEKRTRILSLPSPDNSENI